MTQVDPSGKEAKCDPLCSNCVLGGECLACKIGYALNPTTKQCVFCDGCQSCNGSNVSECTACFAPQILNKTSKACVDISCTIENCLQCDLEGNCRSCLIGFAVNFGVCEKCAVSGCKDCKTLVSTCDQCLDGFIYYISKGKCLPCAAGCKSCKTTDIS